MSIKTRFAPSPTGKLHAGNARAALINWLFAKQQGGQFLLRIDDTDLERSKAEYEEAIKADLAWLGLTWDEQARQSQRFDRYDAAAETLKAAGRLYPCYETPEELDLKRKIALNAGRPPIYDRAALKLTDEDKAKLESEGRQPHWRFKLEDGEIAWDDLIRGSVSFEAANLSDPVLIREDASYLYTLPSVVDDIELEVTHIIRGEDHVTNTAVQAQIFQALAAEVPVFGHFPLLLGAGGESLSKRLGSLGLEELRDAGLEPLALNSYLARLGTPDPIEPFTQMESLTGAFDIARFGRASPKFSEEDLWHLNARVLHGLSFEAVKGWLAEMGMPDFDAALWSAVQPNLEKREDAKLWHAICRGDVSPVIEDGDFLHQAAELLPSEPWDETTWSAWTDAVKEATGRKGKDLFKPLRLALTGLDHGPELKALLPLIGREKALARLDGKTA